MGPCAELQSWGGWRGDLISVLALCSTTAFPCSPQSAAAPALQGTSMSSWWEQGPVPTTTCSAADTGPALGWESLVAWLSPPLLFPSHTGPSGPEGRFSSLEQAAPRSLCAKQ